MPPKTSYRLPLAAVALTALASLLGACRADRAATTGSLYPTDIRTRHPIVLADRARNLDVFVTGRGFLDPRQAADVDAFLLDFRRYGRGTLVLDVPRGIAPGLVAAVDRTVATIRSISAETGIPSSAIVVTGYAVANPSLSSPLRLSFQRMDAKVASQCGLWPQDLGVGDAGFNLRNEPSWNLGCATQANLASQVADPIDLVRARPEGRIDTVRRTQNIEKLREGKDPSTEWRQDGKTSVKSGIGN